LTLFSPIFVNISPTFVNGMAGNWVSLHPASGIASEAARPVQGTVHRLLEQRLPMLHEVGIQNRCWHEKPVDIDSELKYEAVVNGIYL
jgi:hypothetical protein